MKNFILDDILVYDHNTFIINSETGNIRRALYPIDQEAIRIIGNKLTNFGGLYDLISTNFIVFEVIRGIANTKRNKYYKAKIMCNENILQPGNSVAETTVALLKLLEEKLEKPFPWQCIIYELGRGGELKTKYTSEEYGYAFLRLFLKAKKQ